MTLPRLWSFLGLALPTVGALLAGMSATDLTYHLRAGAEVLDGRIPTADTWTFTVAGTPWLDQQWLAQAILAGTFQAFGWTGLALLRAVLTGVAFAALGAAIRARNGALGARAVTLLVLAAFAVAAVSLGLRPQLVGIALFAITVWLLEADRVDARPTRRTWAIVLLTAAWSNLHGSFILGPVLVGLAWLEGLGEGRPGLRRRTVLLVATVAATLVNPFGVGVWAYALGLGLSPEILARVTEWQPTTLRDVPGLLFWASAAAIVVLVARRRTVTSWPDLARLAVFGGLAILAVRGLAWWPVVAAVVAAGLLPERAPGAAHGGSHPPRSSRIAAAMALLVVAMGVIALPAWRPLDPGLGTPRGLVTQAPPGITAALDGLFADDTLDADVRIWAPQPWGSWFEWRFPTATVAVDSRIELFPAGVWREVAAVSAAGIADGTSWSDVLDRYGVGIVVTAGAGDAPLESALRLASPDWRLAYSDGDGSVWVRDGFRP